MDKESEQDFSNLSSNIVSQRIEKTDQINFDGLNSAEEEIVKKEKQITLFHDEEGLKKNLIDAFGNFMKSPEAIQFIHDFPEISKEEKESILLDFFKIISEELGIHYTHHVSNRNWSERDIDIAKKLEEKLNPLFEQMGGMIPKTLDPQKTYEVLFWSAEGKKEAEQYAQKIQNPNYVAFLFQNTMPGKMLNACMDTLYQKGFFSWYSEYVKTIYQAASFHLAKEVKPGMNVYVFSPVHDAESIFDAIEKITIIQNGINPNDENQFTYYCLNNKSAKEYAQLKSALSNTSDDSHKAGINAKITRLLENDDNWEVSSNPTIRAKRSSSGTLRKSDMKNYFELWKKQTNTPITENNNPPSDKKGPLKK